MKPIIKWAGGKTQLVNVIKPMLPQTFNTYYEPFAGGAALLFELIPDKAVINDINSELTNVYTQLKVNSENLIRQLTDLDTHHEEAIDKKEFYYKIKTAFNDFMGSNTAEQAARFVYLNKHCFNGLYRVNSSGKFNVPFNHEKAGKSFNLVQFRQTASFMKNVSIYNGDFEGCLQDIKANDFVFFDPPYDSPVNNNTFTSYTKDGFNQAEQVRLANIFKALTKKGVYCMLTNHNTPLINELYKDFNIKVVPVTRMINSDASNRVGEEVIVTNYDPV